MSFGASITNATGKVTHNGDEVSYVFKQKVTRNFSQNGFYSLGMTNANEAPMVYTDYGRVQDGLMQLTYRNGQWVVYTATALSGSMNATIWIFCKQPNTIPAGSYGMAIYTPKGKLAYETNQKLLQVHSYATLSAMNQTISSSKPARWASQVSNPVAIRAVHNGYASLLILSSPTFDAARGVFFIKNTTVATLPPNVGFGHTSAFAAFVSIINTDLY